MSTEWRDVPNYGGRYQVSITGVVRNSVTGRVLSVRPGSVASAVIKKHKVKGCEVVYA